MGNITGWQQNNSGAANPVQSAFAYDRADQLSGATLTNASSGAAVKQYGYWYDQAGNRTDEQIDSTVSSASHNNLNQLTARSGNSGKMSFEGTLNEPGTVTVGGVAATVDTNNNWKASVTLAPGSNTVPIVATDVNGNVTNKQAQLSVTSGTTSQTIVYDLNGNMTNDGNRSFEWDAVNRMTAINYTGTNPAQRTEFTYNGIGQRVKQIEKSGSTVTSEKRMLWCNMDLREERNASDVVTKRYYKQGMVTGSTIPAAASSKFYYTRDHLGSIREMTDNTAALRARYNYDPYGMRTKLSGDLDCDYGYTGHYFHAPSNLHLTYYRAYDANFGRWVSRDSLLNAEKKQGPNLYLYVANKSLRYIDRYGHQFYEPPINQEPNEYDRCLSGALVGFVSLDWYLAYGRSHGVSDKYSHCLASCRITKTAGESCAELLGNLQEWRSIDPVDSAGDQRANAAGRRGATRCPKKSCEQTCREAGY